MDRSAILTRLREHAPELRSRGVERIALFGSVARGNARTDSDIDLMVEIAPTASLGVFEYVAIVQYLEDLFAERVDVANRDGLKPLVKPAVEREALYAF